MRGKTKRLKIFGWIGVVMVAIASITALTFSWFSDKKGADINITISQASGNAQVDNSLDPKDLVAGNWFIKDISVNLSSKEDVYIRTYAKVTMQTLDSSGNTVVKNDVVECVGVDSTIKGKDNKFYYSVTNANSLTPLKSTKLTLSFAFNVTDKINDEVLRDSSGALKTDLKTTVTYYVDYCQVGGESEWQNLSTDKSSYLISFKNDDGKILKIDHAQYGVTPSFGDTATKEATSEVEYTFKAWNPTIAAVSGKQEYTATYTESSFVATFPITWRGEIAGLSLTGISSASEITGIRFDNPTTVPSEYKNTGKKLASGIRVYQSTSNPTNIAFVYGTIKTAASCYRMFRADGTGDGTNAIPLTNLNSLVFNNFDTSIAENLGDMFCGASKLTTLDLSNWNVPKARATYLMFYGCSSLTTLNLPEFTSVTSLNQMFYNCTSLKTLDLSRFNTSNAGSLYGLFLSCSNLQSINLSGWDTSNVTNMSYMFDSCRSLTNLDLSSFNTSKVTTMRNMFTRCSSLVNVNISSFNTSLVTDMNGMFYDCQKLNTLDLSHFDTSKATDMSYMFDGCIALKNLTIPFNTSSTTDMSGMFQNCVKLTNLDLSSFDMTKVTKVTNMLNNMTDLSVLVTPKNISDSYKIALPTKKADSTDKHMYKEGIAKVVELTKGLSSTVSAKITIYDYIKPVEFSTSWRTQIASLGLTGITTASNITGIAFDDYASFNSSTKKLTINSVSYSNSGKTLPSGIEIWVSDSKSTYIAFVAGSIKAPANCSSLFAYTNGVTLTNLATLVFKNFDTSNVTTMSHMFEGHTGSLKVLDLSCFDTSKVINMQQMFYNSSSLTSINVSSFNTSNVTTMANMFQGCSNLTSLNVLNFNTANVTSMRAMFLGLKKVTSLDLTSFNTAKVTKMEYMFQDGSGLTTINLSSFNTSLVNNMANMFYGCRALQTLDLSHFDTSKVTDMTEMFRGCENLTTLKLGFSTSLVTAVGRMFAYCSKLTYLDLSSFNMVSVVEDATDMFYECAKLSEIVTPQGIKDDYPIYLPGCLEMGEESFPNGKTWYKNGFSLVPNATLTSVFASTASTKVTVIDHVLEGALFPTAHDMAWLAEFDSLFTTEFELENFGTVSPMTNNEITSIRFDTPETLANYENENGFTYFDTGKEFSTGIRIYILDGSQYDISFVYGKIIAPTDCSYLFAPDNGILEQLGWIEFENFDTSNVTNMSSMFYCDYIDADENENCRGSLTDITGLNNFNTSKVTDMSYMFYGVQLVGDLDLSSFDTSNVTTMEQMFAYSSVTSLNLTSFNTSKVTAMDCMFSDCSSLTSLNVSSFNTSKVTSMSYMFESCTKLTSLNVSSFDTSKVTSMSGMFYNCSKLTTLDLTKFNTSNVTNMNYMFYGCENLTTIKLNKTNFDTSKVTDMSYMFRGCENLSSVDVSGFNTSKVTKMTSMFSFCYKLASIDISGWDFSLVTDVSYMFMNCSSLTSLPAISLPKATNLSWMFNGCSKLSSVKVSCSSSATNFLTMFSSCASLTELDLSGLNMSAASKVASMLSGATALTKITAPSALSSGAFISLPTGKNWYVEGNNANKKTSITNDSTVLGKVILDHVLEATLDIDWQTKIVNLGIGITDVTKINSIQFLKPTEIPSGYTNTNKILTSGIQVYKSSSSDLDIAFVCEKIYAPATSSSLFKGLTALKTLTFKNFDTSKATTMQAMFQNCSSLQSLDLSSFNTAKVTSMREMFDGCSSLTTINVSSFDTSNVTSMQSMFANCNALTSLNLSNFKTPKVTTMAKMFYNCRVLASLVISSFNTSNVTTMEQMFEACNKLSTLNVSNFDTSKVINMHSMFDGCVLLSTLNVSNFNTSNVEDFRAMFWRVSGITSLDLSSFDTSKATDMQFMFAHCTALKTVNLSSFNTSNVIVMQQMFIDCPSLEELDLSSFDMTKVTSVSDMFSGCTALTRIVIPQNIQSSYPITLPTGKTWYQGGFFDSVVTTLSSNTYAYGYKCTEVLAYILRATLDSDWRSQLENAGVTVTNSTYLMIASPDSINANMAYNAIKLKSGILVEHGENSEGELSIWLSYPEIITPIDSTGLFANLGEIAFYTSGDHQVLFTSQTKIFDYFFAGTRVSCFNGSLSQISTSSATSMKGMFSRSGSGSYMSFGSSGAFSTSNVTDFSNMFAGCASVNEIDFTCFNIKSGAIGTGFLDGCSSLKTIIAPTTIASGVSIPLPADKTWYIKDTNTVVTEFKSSVAGKTLVLTLTASLDTNWKTQVVALKMPEITAVNKITSIIFETPSSLPSTYKYAGKLTSGIKVYQNNAVSRITEIAFVADKIYGPVNSNELFDGLSGLTSITFYNFDTSKVEGMSFMFRNCSSLSSLDLSKFNTTSVKEMHGMFHSCVNLTSLNLTSFNTANVTTMYAMFYSCEKLPTLTVSNFNTGKVTTMSNMFANCKALTRLDLIKFDTSNVTDMQAMFDGCSSLTAVRLSSFNTSNVTEMRYMFRGCSKLANLNLSNFDTAKVTNMRYMFQNCSSLADVNVFSFDTSAVTEMAGMFAGCSSLTSLLSIVDFETANVTDMSNMFANCYKLTSLDLEGWNTASVTTMASMFDTCTSLKVLTTGSNFVCTKATNLSNMFYACNDIRVIDLSAFNTNVTTNMSYMFGECYSLLKITFGSSFTTGLVTNFTQMFKDCYSLASLDLSRFEILSSANVTDMLSINNSNNHFVLSSIKAPKSIGKAIALPTSNGSTTKYFSQYAGSATSISSMTSTYAGKTLYRGSSSYRILDYLEFTGSEYVDTGAKASYYYMFNNTTNVSVVNSFTDTTHDMILFGSQNSPSQRQFIMYHNNLNKSSTGTSTVKANMGGTINTMNYGDSSQIHTVGITSSKRYYFDSNGATHSSTASWIASFETLYIGALNYNGVADTSNGFRGKIYLCSVGTDFFIPVVNNTTGTKGLWNVYDSTFHPLQGQALPTGYTKLNYLKSTGTQYINTGLSWSTSLKIEVKFANYTSSINSGAVCGTDGWIGTLTRLATATQLRWVPQASKCHMYTSFSTSGTYIVSASNSSMLVISGSTRSSIAASDDSGNTSSGTFKIFKGQGKCGALTMYYFKIWNGTNLVRDLVPAKNSSGVLGMYDLIYGTFYTNAGTGSFTGA